MKYIWDLLQVIGERRSRGEQKQERIIHEFLIVEKVIGSLGFIILFSSLYIWNFPLKLLKVKYDLFHVEIPLYFFAVIFQFMSLVLLLSRLPQWKMTIAMMNWKEMQSYVYH